MNVDYLALATEYAAKQGNTIVLPAGIESGWHYFAHTRPNLPRYGSLPNAIRINSKGEIEDIDGFVMRSRVSRKAYELRNAKNALD